MISMKVALKPGDEMDVPNWTCVKAANGAESPSDRITFVGHIHFVIPFF